MSPTPRQREYARYLASPTWAKNKKAWKGGPLARRGECFCCGASDRGLDFHHLTYRNVGKEKRHELKQLCRSCHTAVHALAAERRINLFTATWAHRKATYPKQGVGT